MFHNRICTCCAIFALCFITLTFAEESAKKGSSVDCVKNNGGCEQLCITGVQNDSCACEHGYDLGTDRQTCYKLEVVNAAVNVSVSSKEEFGCESETCFEKDMDINKIIIKKATSESCSVDNGGCEGVCKIVEAGVECVCPDGFFLKENKRSCAVNFCYFNNGNCEGTCESAEEGSICSCPKNYILDIDRRSCVANNGSLWSSTS